MGLKQKIIKKIKIWEKTPSWIVTINTIPN